MDAGTAREQLERGLRDDNTELVRASLALGADARNPDAPDSYLLLARRYLGAVVALRQIRVEAEPALAEAGAESAGSAGVWRITGYWPDRRH